MQIVIWLFGDFRPVLSVSQSRPIVCNCMQEISLIYEFVTNNIYPNMETLFSTNYVGKHIEKIASAPKMTGVDYNKVPPCQFHKLTSTSLRARQSSSQPIQLGSEIPEEWKRDFLGSADSLKAEGSECTCCKLQADILSDIFYRNLIRTANVSIWLILNEKQDQFCPVT